jgi:hypothetical protein
MLVRDRALRASRGARLIANHVFDRHFNAVDKHLVDLLLAVERSDRAHGDARGLPLDKDESYPSLLLRCVSISAHQCENPVRLMRERNPGLLAADGVVLAHVVGRGLQRGEIRARAGLAEALASPLGAAKHTEQKTLPLRLRAEVDED